MFLPSQLFSAELTPTGILGNSGISGERLVRVAPFDRKLRAHLGPSALTGLNARVGNATGVIVDQDTLLVSGGDRINRLSLNGQLIESFSLEPAGSLADSRVFVVYRETLYFLGRPPKGPVGLFALPLAKPATATLVTNVLLPTPTGASPLSLADHPLPGGLGLVYEPKEAPGTTNVEVLDPVTSSRRLLATLPCDYPSSAAVTDDGRIFVGARFKELLSKSAGHNTAAGITCLSPDGQTLPGFPVSCTFNGASAIQYRGDISFADGALWELGWMGKMARLDRDTKAAPGNIELGGPSCDVDAPSQLTPVASGLVAISSSGYDSVHLMRTSRRESVSFARRIGCLPEVTALGLSPEGWIIAGTPRGARWWRWDDAPDAPARSSQHLTPVTGGVFSGEKFFTLSPQAGIPRALPGYFDPELGTTMGFWDRKKTPIANQCVPMQQPVALSISPAVDKIPIGFAYAIDAQDRSVWRTKFDWRSFQTPDIEWQRVAIESPLSQPTGIVALSGGRLLIADAGALRLLAPAGEMLRDEWRLEKWGEGPEEHFGKNIRLTVTGPYLAISDTERHRVLIMDWEAKKVLAQAGATDRAGTGWRELSAPTHLAAAGNRLVVFDSANQRLVTFEYRP